MHRCVCLCNADFPSTTLSMSRVATQNAHAMHYVVCRISNQRGRPRGSAEQPFVSVNPAGSEHGTIPLQLF